MGTWVVGTQQLGTWGVILYVFHYLHPWYILGNSTDSRHGREVVASSTTLELDSSSNVLRDLEIAF